MEKTMIRAEPVKKPFDRLSEVKEGAETSNATPKCMWILERGALRSKSKCLAEQAKKPLGCHWL